MSIPLIRHVVLAAALIPPSAFGAETQPAPPSTGLPVTLSLDKSGYVTAVIERTDGRCVSNLASKVKAQAGPLTFNWDFYDVGVQKGEKAVLHAYDAVSMRSEGTPTPP